MRTTGGRVQRTHPTISNVCLASMGLNDLIMQAIDKDFFVRIAHARYCVFERDTASNAYSPLQLKGDHGLC
jgi:hypothetical protein